jgi:hypothetical protein
MCTFANPVGKDAPEEISARKCAMCKLNANGPIWFCSKCDRHGLQPFPLSFQYCVLCGAPQPGVQSVAAASPIGHRPPGGRVTSPQWECSRCTLLNDDSITECVACCATRPLVNDARGPQRSGASLPHTFT